MTNLLIEVLIGCAFLPIIILLIVVAFERRDAKPTPPRTYKRTYEEVYGHLGIYLDSLDEATREKLMLAVALAGVAHSLQMRKVNPGSDIPAQPYIIHPIRVMMLLAVELQSTNVPLLIAALLHDAIEDGKGRVTYEQIRRSFGDEVVTLVEHVTKPDGKMIDEQKEAYHNRIANASESVRLLKLADRIDNLRDILYLDKKEFQLKQLAETRKHFLTMAATTNTYMHGELVSLCNELSQRVA